MSIDYPPPPSLDEATPHTRRLHKSINAYGQQCGYPYLNPESPTVQIDLFHGDRVADWQNAKASAAMLGTTSSSILEPIYARYATHETNHLIKSICKIENCAAALVTDSGMQACALIMDALIRPGSHVIMSEQVYAKTKSFLSGPQLEWISNSAVNHLTPIIKSRCMPNTTLVLGETFSNPLMRALDLKGLSDKSSRYGKTKRLVCDLS